MGVELQTLQRQKLGSIPYRRGSQWDVPTNDPATGYVPMWQSNGTLLWVPQSSIDHGSLGGLADDDHTQYVLANGTRDIAASNVEQEIKNTDANGRAAFKLTGRNGGADNAWYLTSRGAADAPNNRLTFINDGLSTRLTLSEAGGLSVNADIDAGAGVVNANTGFRVTNAATSGNVLRGDGTNFVSSAIQAGDLPSHTHTAHTDRTRRFYVPARLFWSALTGTPAYASVGAAQVNAENWAMDGTTDEAIGTLVQMPADWAGGTITPYFVWAPSNTTVGNVAWICRITSIASGEAFNQALESTSGTVVAAAGGVQYGTNFTSMGAIAAGTGTASALLRILAYRFATDASDTYNALDALFLGMYIEYTADM